jgi:hypothetical protein
MKKIYDVFKKYSIKVLKTLKLLSFYLLVFLWFLANLPAMIPSFMVYYFIDNWSKGRELYFLIWQLLLQKKLNVPEDE